MQSVGYALECALNRLADFMQAEWSIFSAEYYGDVLSVYVESPTESQAKSELKDFISRSLGFTPDAGSIHVIERSSSMCRCGYSLSVSKTFYISTPAQEDKTDDEDDEDEIDYDKADSEAWEMIQDSILSPEEQEAENMQLYLKDIYENGERFY